MVSYREAVVNDIPALAQLMGSLGYPTTTHEMVKRFEQLVKYPYHTVVGESNGLVVAVMGLHHCFMYEKNGSFVRVAALVVDEQFRGHGIGHSLIQIAETWARELGAVALLLNSGAQRKDAHRFYKRVGFAEKGLSFFKSL